MRIHKCAMGISQCVHTLLKRKVEQAFSFITHTKARRGSHGRWVFFTENSFLKEWFWKGLAFTEAVIKFCECAKRECLCQERYGWGKEKERGAEQQGTERNQTSLAALWLSFCNLNWILTEGAELAQNGFQQLSPKEMENHCFHYFIMHSWINMKHVNIGFSGTILGIVNLSLQATPSAHG